MESVAHYNIGIASLVAYSLAGISEKYLQLRRAFVQIRSATISWTAWPLLQYNSCHEGNLPFTKGHRVPAPNHNYLVELGLIMQMLYLYRKTIATGVVVPADVILRAIAINIMDGNLGWPSRRVLMKCYNLQLPTIDGVLADLHEEAAQGRSFSFDHCKGYEPTQDGDWDLKGAIVVQGYVRKDERRGRIVSGTVIAHKSETYLVKACFPLDFQNLSSKMTESKRFRWKLKNFTMYKALMMLDRDMFNAYKPQDENEEELLNYVVHQVTISFTASNALDRLRWVLATYPQYFKSRLDIPGDQASLQHLGSLIAKYLEIPDFLAKPCNAFLGGDKIRL